MRKTLFFICLFLLLPVCLAFGSEPGLTVHGPQTLYTKDVFDLNLICQGQLPSRMEFTLTYDTENIISLGIVMDSQGDWDCQPVGNRFTFVCKDLSTDDPIPSLRFSLRRVDPGTAVWVKLGDVVILSGGVEKKLGDIRWDKTVDRPASADNYLASLKISDGALSPAFSHTTQNYTATVSHHVASIDVMASARDPYAQVTVHNPALAPNSVTNVTVTVRAEDGTERIYTIAVKREEDPNRPLSADCSLANITVDGFLLSPVFSANIKEYVLWLPYEISKVDIKGVARDPRAKVTVSGNTELKPGKDNVIIITCTAEDGSQMLYTVIAKRAEEYVPETTVAPTDPTVTPTQASEPEITEPTQIPQTQTPEEGTVYSVEIPAWTYILTAVTAVTGAGAIGILLSERKK